MRRDSERSWRTTSAGLRRIAELKFGYVGEIKAGVLERVFARTESINPSYFTKFTFILPEHDGENSHCPDFDTAAVL